jgi:hypothetical protein
MSCPYDMLYSSILYFVYTVESRSIVFKGVEKTNGEYGKRLIRKTNFFKAKKYIVFCGWSLESRFQDGRQCSSHLQLKYLSVQELIRAQDWTRMSCCADRNFKLG